MTVHLVNLTNPMMLKAPYSELIPSPAQAVSVRLPAGTKPRAVQLLIGGQNPAIDQVGDVLNLTIPSILDHELVAIDL